MAQFIAYFQRLPRIVQFGLWGLAQGLITCLGIVVAEGPSHLTWNGFPTAFAQIIIIGIIASIVTFGLLTRLSRELIFLAFPIAGVVVPIAIIPGSNFIECARLWNCDPRLSGSDAALVEAVLTEVWSLFELLFGIIAAIVYFGIQPKREPLLDSDKSR